MTTIETTEETGTRCDLCGANPEKNRTACAGCLALYEVALLQAEALDAGSQLRKYEKKRQAAWGGALKKQNEYRELVDEQRRMQAQNAAYAMDPKKSIVDLIVPPPVDVSKYIPIPPPKRKIGNGKEPGA